MCHTMSISRTGPMSRSTRMNPILNPEHVHPGAILTRAEFEGYAIDAKAMEDLMDEDDLGPTQFIQQAISRANVRRTPQNLYLWVGTEKFETIVLVKAEYAPLVQQMRTALKLHEEQAIVLRRALETLITTGGKP